MANTGFLPERASFSAPIDRTASPASPDDACSEFTTEVSSFAEGTLAELAGKLHLGDYLSLGPGEIKSGGQRRASTLADALEAIIGAVYLDGGFEAGRDMVLGLYQDSLQNLPAAVNLKDPKTRLQEYLQSRHRPTPDYSVIEVAGEAHAQTFRVECHAVGAPVTVGAGSTRRRAEQEAAEQALLLLEQDKAR